MPRKDLDYLSLDDRPMAITGSINFKDYSELDRNILQERFQYIVDTWNAVRDYYFIFHNETDTFHLHYILIFNQQQYVKTCLTRLCEGMQVETDAVNYKKLLHRNAMLRYILHIDPSSIKQGKKKYEKYDIITNINYTLLSCFVDSKDDDKNLDFLTIQAICYQCNFDRFKICETLDNLYKKYIYMIDLAIESMGRIKLKFDGSDLPF